MPTFFIILSILNYLKKLYFFSAGTGVTVVAAEIGDFRTCGALKLVVNC